MKREIKYLIFCFVAFGFDSLISQDMPAEYRLVYHQDFSTPQAILDFDMTDPSAWKIDKTGMNSVLALYSASKYASRIRSPFNIAVIQSLKVSDFVLEVKLAQTGKEYGHRDLCLFFGLQDPTNFYYVHLATTADDHANNIFIVNDAPRIKIASKTSTGTDWGTTDSWHTARIERKVDEGSIKVFFDDLEEPVMEASDIHFVSGHIGVGSFDDTGKFDDLKIWAPFVTRSKESIFHE